MSAVAVASLAVWTLSREARAMLTRLGRVKSFAMAETMVPAATLSVEAQAAIERYLQEGRRRLKQQILRYLSWLEGPAGLGATPEEAQRRYTFLRLRFNVVLSHFDIFSEAMSQRSEVDNGVWLAGLDAVAKDALDLPGYLDAPPVICYLARGPGAAIRRARTRLPGGGENPVAVVRMPRERMIGSGIASSLIHEVGHQAAALLGLVPAALAGLDEVPLRTAEERFAWPLWKRWMSETLADVWAVSRVGVTSTTGLVAVVSLPRPFVFRLSLTDPHPPPWIRVKLSAAVGQALYPHPQWERLSALWESFYPLAGLDAERRRAFTALEASLPRLVDFLVERFRPASLRGRTLPEVMGTDERQPAELVSLYRQWRARPARLRAARPALVFAVIGQARADGVLDPEEEGDLLSEMLKYWALRGTIDASEICASLKRARAAEAALPGPALPRGLGN